MKDSIGEYKLAFYYLPLSAELNQNQLDQIPPKAYGPDPSDDKMHIESEPLLDY